jgi:ribonuclease-3
MAALPGRDAIEARVGLTVHDVALFQQACLHKSALRLHNNTGSYERLEFLGDSVLNFVVTRYLFERYPRSSEGFLTRIRTKLVSGMTLCTLASKLGLQDLVVMNDRANRLGWRNNDRIKEDIFEAIVGALYLDQGIPTCRRWIVQLLETHVDWDHLLEDTNFKDILMRTCQANGWELPEYRMEQASGPEHQRQFTVAVWVRGARVSEGADCSKKRAEQHAARLALDALGMEAPVASSTYS